MSGAVGYADRHAIASARAFAAAARDIGFAQSVDFNPRLLATPWRALAEAFRRFADGDEAQLRLLGPDDRLVRLLGAVGDQLPALGVGEASWVVAQVAHAEADPEWGALGPGVVEIARARKARDDREESLFAGGPVPDVPVSRDGVASSSDAEVAALHREVAEYLSAQGRSASRPAGEEGAALLDAVLTFVRRFVVVEDHQAVACALWAIHAHAIDAAQTTAYLHLTSAEKRSGKSTLLEVLELLSPRPLLTSNISPAALFRLLAEKPGPTMFVDEVDATFSRKSGNESAEDLRGLLNAGYRRGQFAVRMVGQGAAMKPERFAVFGAKALAGIRDLPDTLADRCIRIEMKRKAKGEGAARFRRRKVEPEAAEIQARIIAWVEPLLDSLTDVEPGVPADLDDRAAEGWEPLIAIADAAGGEWPARARAAAVSLSAHRMDADGDSLGVRLLADIRSVFEGKATERMFSHALVAALIDIEEAPWSDLFGRALTKTKLAQMLRPYDVAPRSTRVGDETRKGYARESFSDCWARYVTPPPAISTVTPSHLAAEARSGHSAEYPAAAADGEYPASVGQCDGVTVEGGREGDTYPADVDVECGTALSGGDDGCPP